MIRVMKHALFLIFLAQSAAAETPMTGEEFDAYVTGRTLTFSTDSGPYGVERYLPGRRVLWSFLDGECEEGEWYSEEGAICFVYGFEPEPQCWAMYLEGDTLRAEFLNNPSTSVLYEALEGQEQMICGNFGA